MQTETVVVLTAGYDLDPYSEEMVQSWEWTPTEREVQTIAPAEPRPSQEPVQNDRNSVVSGWTLYLPAGDPITSADHVRVRGVEYPVQGQPAEWLGAGVVVQAFKTEG